MAKHEAGVPLMDETLNMMMFADDIVLLSTSAQGLRKHLETLENYCSKWNLQIEAKSKSLCLVLIIHINFTAIHFLWKWWRIISIWDCGFPRREISKKPYTSC